MACNCIAKLDEKLAEHNSRVSVGFTFGSRDGEMGYTFPSLTTEKIDKRNRKTMGVMPTFCPFCGTRYRAEAVAATT